VVAAISSAAGAKLQLLMLNIGKLAPGGEGYYLETVASGVEDYYTGSGEAPGYWLGGAAAELGIAGRVQPEALRAVLGAVDPRTGEALTGSKSRRSIPGFDCTFRAPKSVSLLYGLGDVTTAMTVRDAHDAAVAAALGYLETHAGFSRRGHAGVERVGTGGFAAAAFRHRTSRAGDPLLHTHVLVANIGRAVDDGRWRTLDARALYLHAKTAGFLYQAQLRVELSRRLGVEWRPVRNGCADLQGVSDEVIRAFSQRRVEIEEHMARRGETSAKAAQVATLATRKAKDRGVDAAVLGAEWLVRAAALGFGAEQVSALTGRVVHRDPEPPELITVAEDLAGPDGLTARASTFCRRDVVRAWCDRLPAGGDVDQVLELADAVLADGSVTVQLDHAQADVQRLAADQAIRRADGVMVAAVVDEARYSTPELLALEQRALASAVQRHDAGVAVAANPALEAALARRPSISGEQADMVSRLVTSGAGVEAVVGKAGAGKTFALDAAREAWQASGIRVIGCALAARAAQELHAGAGIDSHTIDALLMELDRPAPWGLGEGIVVVVDEAAMVGTRKLARLLDHARRASAKLVLVGDHHQLPEIDAGGLFRGLVNRLPVIELAHNRRQRAVWEREALDELRTGDPAAALAAYTKMGRIVVGDTAEAVREQLVSDWWTARCAHTGTGEPGVMIAARVSDVDDLNDRARSRLAGAGELTGPALSTDTGREFRTGDRVVCLRNDYRVGVANGSRGLVIGVDALARTIEVRLDDSSNLMLPCDYVDAGHVTHGYAITGHKAQGMTVDRTWVLGSDSVYREWGYVALSRGRDSNRFYVVAGYDADEHLHAKDLSVGGDGVQAISAALRRSHAQQLASDQNATAIATRDAHAPSTRTGGRLHNDINAITGVAAGRRIERLQHEHERAVEGAAAVRLRLDTALQDAGRHMGLRRLRGRNDAHSNAAELARLRGDLAAWHHRIADIEAQLSSPTEDRQGSSAANRGAIRSSPLNPLDAAALRCAVESAEFEAPSYVAAALGERPATPLLRQRWRAAVHAIECYRATWSVTDRDSALGPAPASGRQRYAFRAALEVVDEVARGLAVDYSKELVRGAPRLPDHCGIEIG
jgi:conjugative relaxase-like TrwC/TraI family protein